MDRRQFLGRASGMGVALGLGSSFWDRALSQTAEPGVSPYGPLLPPDANGLQLPAGFTSRVVANSLAAVPGTTHVWHVFPDGGACVPTDDGGWIYVSNSEFPPPVDIPQVTSTIAGLQALLGTLGLPVPTSGGVGAIRFDADGAVVDAYPILTGSQSNCAGGLTPWGTWLSCEEWEDADSAEFAAGKVWECDPFGIAPFVDRPALGRFKHEMAACDPIRQQIYLSEDQSDGLFYRYTPPPGSWGSGAALEGGSMEAMAVADDGTVTWLPVPGAAAPSSPLRGSVPGATPFISGEGVIYDDGRIYLTTKPPDDKVWAYDIEAGTMQVLYDATSWPADVVTLNGVDNIAVSAAHDLYVAEDGGNLEVCVITPELVVAPVVRMTGGQHGFDSGTEIPMMSEVTGLAFSPDGNRLYFNSERGNGVLPTGVAFPGPGILYEVTGPFRGGTLAQAPPPASSTTTTTGTPAASPSPAAGSATPLAATGGPDRFGTGAAAAAVAAALWQLRRRLGDPPPR